LVITAYLMHFSCCSQDVFVQWHRANKHVVRIRMKQSMLIAGSRMKAGKEFQTVGPASEKARRPKCRT